MTLDKTLSVNGWIYVGSPKRERLKSGWFLSHSDDLAVVLRPTVVAPRTIVELAKRLDNVRSLSRVFVPEGS